LSERSRGQSFANEPTVAAHVQTGAPCSSLSRSTPLSIVAERLQPLKVPRSRAGRGSRSRRSGRAVAQTTEAPEGVVPGVCARDPERRAVAGDRARFTVRFRVFHPLLTTAEESFLCEPS
jgi:hypothetical protein